MRRIFFLLLSLCLGATSALADENKYVYHDALTVDAGTEVTLSVKMKNDIPLSGYQYDLVLPEGISIVVDEDEFPAAFLSTARTTPAKMNFFDSSIQANGSFRVLCYSSKGYTFSGTDGEITLITIKIDENMISGTYEGRFEDIQLSYAGNSYDTELVTFDITVNGKDPEPDPQPSSLWGDLNNDGQVSIADVNTLIEYLLRNETSAGGNSNQNNPY